MKCVICGHESGYNRAVVDKFSGAKIGQLCMNCERDEFGKVFDYEASGDCQCVLCQRDGQIAFPRFVPVESTAESDVVVVKSVIEDAESPQLCDEHFHTITGSTEPNKVIKR